MPQTSTVIASLLLVLTAGAGLGAATTSMATSPAQGAESPAVVAVAASAWLPHVERMAHQTLHQILASEPARLQAARTRLAGATAPNPWLKWLILIPLALVVEAHRRSRSRTIVQVRRNRAGLVLETSPGGGSLFTLRRPGQTPGPRGPHPVPTPAMAAGAGSGSGTPVLASLPAAPASASRSRSAFSLLEVMIVVALLGTVLMIMMSGIYSLNQATEGSRQKAVAEEVLQVMAERLDGALWLSLGQTSQPWSWHRRYLPGSGTTPFNPPMVDGGTVPNNDLEALGLLTAPSGLTDLKVYLEYYTVAMMTDPNVAANWLPALPSTNTATVRSSYVFPIEDPSIFNLNTYQEGIVGRIVVTWTDVNHATRMEDLVMTRRP